MSKTPNLIQKPTGPTIYKPMTLPPMVTLHKQTTNPALPSRINQNTPAAPVSRQPRPRASALSHDQHPQPSQEVSP